MTFSSRRSAWPSRRWAVVLLILATGVGATGCWLFRGEGAEPQQAGASAEPPADESDALSAEGPPDGVSVPEGMVYVPGGTTKIGVSAETFAAIRRAQEPGTRHLWGANAHPPFTADVEPYFMDRHPVTVAEFRAFVEATGYVTEAERFGNAGVLDRQTGRWRLVDGATWRHPFGPDRPAAPDDHPVTQVSWHDAQAYAEWADGRLPTEVEWEHAARGALNRRAFCPWGSNERVVDGRFMANTWQGTFPVRNTAEDGYRYTSPVGAFGETALGLQDMSGNVWEWTSSWYRPYPERGTPFRPTKRSEKVQRGGSFLCNECGGYRVFARSHATPETSLFHVGFRCVRDLPADEEDPLNG